MKRLFALLGGLGLGLSALLFWPRSKSLPEPDRLGSISQRRLPDVQNLFLRAQAHWPPRALFLRGFKQEGELELWEGPPGKRGWVRVAVFPVLGKSGGPGPKCREGDLQVPEGAYVIDRMNPQSRFHLSLGLNYPNASDRVRSDPQQPGSDIFIHGGSATVGCLPIGDEAIELLYLAVAEVFSRPGAEIPVHLFPFRMTSARLRLASSQYPAHAGFWEELQPLYEAFESGGIPPAAHYEAGTGRLFVPAAFPERGVKLPREDSSGFSGD